MKESELDTIIRLIPTASVRQAQIIVGQIDIHLKLNTTLKVYPRIFRSNCCLCSVHSESDECLCCGDKNGFFAELESGHDEDDIKMFTGWTEKEFDDFFQEVARDCHYHLDDDCDQILDSVIEMIMDQPEEYKCDSVKQTERT